MNYKVVIPTAGLGSRLKGLSRHINKALVSIAHKPVISYVVEKMPKDVPIVVPLGYKGDMVRDYLLLAHPEYTFEFVDVFPFEGPGSGLGLTLLTCADRLDCPFIFCSNDTIVLEAIPAPTSNWMGYMEVEDHSEYRCIRLNDKNRVEEICSKGAQGDVKPYIGLSGIKDYKLFWDSMRHNNDESLAIGESFGLRHLISKGIEGRRFTWYDTGNLEALKHAREAFHPSHDAIILEKENEAIWFVNEQVIKFSTDTDFIKNRVARGHKLTPYTPAITGHKPNMYRYTMVHGTTMSRNPNPILFKNFLEIMKGFWQSHELNKEEIAAFKARCDFFYHQKTIQRVRDYFLKSESFDAPSTVNGVYLDKMSIILERLDWKDIADGVPVRFHGDLHFENILLTEDAKNPFLLLDWRQDFGGDLEIGDIYYDLAKLAHGLIISHELIEKQLFHITQNGNIIDYDFLKKNSLTQCLEILENWCEQNSYSYDKVMVITALIFINIAPLHHYPYSKFLFFMGKHMLAKSLDQIRKNDAA